MKKLVLMMGALVLAGCATNVPPSRVRQVQQATNTGPYSYQRPMSGPPVPMR